MKPTDILAIGTAYVDINCPGFPFSEDGFMPETETVGGDYEAVLGGSGLTFCKLSKRLGLSATFAGKIGDDKTGAILASLLEEAGVQSALITDPKVSTSISMNVVNNQGQYIGMVAGTASRSLRQEEVREAVGDILPKVKYVYLSGLFKLKKLLPAFADLVREAKKAGVVVIVDHGRVVNDVSGNEMQMVRELVQAADYYFPSRDEFMQLWGEHTIVEGLVDIVDVCGGQTIVKDGAGGAIGLVGGRAVRVPAFEVEVINTVGAGDAFNAGFIAAHHKGLDIEESMRFGCATAALKISREKLPTRAELEVLIAKQ